MNKILEIVSVEDGDMVYAEIAGTEYGYHQQKKYMTEGDESGCHTACDSIDPVSIARKNEIIEQINALIEKL